MKRIFLTAFVAVVLLATSQVVRAQDSHSVDLEPTTTTKVDTVPSIDEINASVKRSKDNQQALENQQTEINRLKQHPNHQLVMIVHHGRSRRHGTRRYASHRGRRIIHLERAAYYTAQNAHEITRLEQEVATLKKQPIVHTLTLQPVGKVDKDKTSPWPIYLFLTIVLLLIVICFKKITELEYVQKKHGERIAAVEGFIKGIKDKAQQPIAFITLFFRGAAKKRGRYYMVKGDILHSVTDVTKS